MPQAVSIDLLKYVDNSSLVFSIQRQSNIDLANFYKCLIDNKLSIRFGEDKLNIFFLAQTIRRNTTYKELDIK